MIISMNFIKYLFPILAFSLFRIAIAKSQNNREFSAQEEYYVKGYVINKNNDSIPGLIDFRTDEQNGCFCYFKLSKEAPTQIFFPNDILQYRFIDENRYYVSHEITIDSIPRLVFLEYLVNGVMNLYYYKDPATFQVYYFFEDESGNMTAIRKKPDKIIDSEVHSDNQYYGILTYLFQNYPTIRRKLSKGTTPIAYERDNMIEIVKEYHKQTCSPGQKCIVYVNNYREKNIIDLLLYPLLEGVKSTTNAAVKNVRLSAYTGFQVMNFSTKKLTGTEYIFTPDPMNSLCPTVGGQLFITTPWNRSLGILGDVGISKIKGNTESHIDGDVPTQYEFNFSSLMLMSKLNVKFIYPTKGTIRPVAEAGFSYFKLFNKSSGLYVKETYVTRYHEDYGNLPEPKLSGFNCGVGADYLLRNNHSIFCRFSYVDVNSIQIVGTEYARFTNRIKAGQFKIGYIF